jgi:hypothetical protein
MGKTKPKTVSELMEVANRFIDGENAYHNKRAQLPEHDRPNRYNSQRCRSRNDDGPNSRNQVATGYKGSSKEGGERRNSGYRSRENSGGGRQLRSRNFDPSPEDILNGPCHVHYAYLDGKRLSNHLMRDCKTFMKLQEAIGFRHAEKPGSIAYGTPPPPPSYNGDAANQGHPSSYRKSNKGYLQSEVHIAAMIQPVPKSKKEHKNISRQVNLANKGIANKAHYLDTPEAR